MGPAEQRAVKLRGAASGTCASLGRGEVKVKHGVRKARSLSREQPSPATQLQGHGLRHLHGWQHGSCTGA